MAIGNALVTGASAGIGTVFARRLAQRNYNLVLVARRQERLDAIAEALIDSYGISCAVVPLDLADPAGCQQLEDRVAELDIRVDYLVNNAGVGMAGPFATHSLDRLASMMHLNMLSLTELTARFLPGMLARGSGVVLNVASTASFLPMPYFAVYGATKAYVLNFTEALAEEVRGQGVTVSCLCPGPTTTEFNHLAGVDSGIGKFVYMSPEAVVDEALPRVDRGDVVIVPGVVPRVQMAGARFGPRGLNKRLMARIFKRLASPSGSGH